jgi:hypothetical protein
MDKATANNFKYTFDPNKNCGTCCLKSAVPHWWCDQVAQQVMHRRVCDRHTGVSNQEVSDVRA